MAGSGFHRTDRNYVSTAIFFPLKIVCDATLNTCDLARHSLMSGPLPKSKPYRTGGIVAAMKIAAGAGRGDDQLLEYSETGPKLL